MKRLLCIVLLAAACLAPAAVAAPPAQAQRVKLGRATDGYFYFNRPGADMATHDAELKDCIDGTGLQAMAAVVQPPRPTGRPSRRPPPDPRYDGAVRDPSGRVNSETCMIVRGWRVVRVEAKFGQPLLRASRARVVDALKDQVGAEHPTGEIVRVWNNDALYPETDQISTPSMVLGFNLSVLAMNPAAPPPARPLDRIPYRGAVQRPPSPYTILKASELPAAVPAGSAMIVFRLLGDRTQGGQSLSFTQVGAQFDPSVPSVYPVAFYAVLATSFPPTGHGDRKQALGAVVVPAGKWRIHSLWLTAIYCMGSPAFEVRPGDVVFTGTVDLAAATRAPDMTLDPARDFLSGQPALASAVRPASWVNGTTSPCLGPFAYSLEFPGYPFEPDYIWGSRARTPAG